MERLKQEFERVVAEKTTELLNDSETFQDAYSAAAEMSWSKEPMEKAVGFRVMRNINQRALGAEIKK